MLFRFFNDLFRHPVRTKLAVFAMSGLAVLVIAGCSSASTPEVVEREVEVTRVVTEVVEAEVTRIVTQEVEVMVTPAPSSEDETSTEEEAPPPTPEPFVPATDIIASGLLSPRQLFYTEDGTLFITEAGIAGEGEVIVDPETVVGAGLTSRISAVAPDGTQSVVVPALPSVQMSPGNTGFRGAQAIVVTDDAYWIGVGEGPTSLQGLSLFRTVMELDRETWRIGNLIDTAAAAQEAGQPDPAAINSDPTDLILAEDGTLLIADAGCNCLWSWTAEDGLALFTSWDIDDNPVPTGVDIGPEGDIYVSFLTGFPFPEGGSRIERWSPEGELLQTYEGLTLLTDVLIAEDGTIYAVELAAGLGERGFIPDSGRVVIVGEDGIVPVMEGLRTPYGLAQSPDGDLVVSVVSAFDVSGSGMVIAVEGP